jgi:predicted transcriptional regulator
MTKDLVVAQIRTDHMSPEDVHESTRHIFENLLALKSREAAESPGDAPAVDRPRAPSDWRKSITRQAITCMECGQTFKQLSGRHLRQHNLNARSYRRKYGIPQNQPLAARETAAKRRRIAAEVKPWESAPAYIKAQQAKAAAKKSGRKKAPRAKRKA